MGYITCVNIGTIVVVLTLTEIVSGTLHFNKKLTGVNLNSYVQVSLKECSRKCDARTNCLSFNYNRLFHLCELNLESYVLSVKSAAFDAPPGWLIQNADMDARTGNCEKNSCETGTICIDTGDSFECGVKECSKSFLNLQNGAIFGNIASVGSKVKINCDSGYFPTNGRSSQCEDTGHWNNSPICEDTQTLCSVLDHFISDTTPNITDAEIITGDKNSIYTSENISGLSSMEYVSDGSVITIQCTTSEYVKSPIKLFCSSGTWTYAPDCFNSGENFPCTAVTQCTNMLDSACNEVICSCPYGTSYMYSNSQCMKTCPNGLADTFSMHQYYSLGNTYFSSSTYSSVADCKQRCMSSNSPVCTSFEFDHLRYNRPCFLYDISSSHDNGMYWSYGHHYIRDCL